MYYNIGFQLQISMNGNFKEYSHDKVIRFSTSIAVCILVIHTVLLAFMQGKLPPIVPFFNSMPWGTDRLLEARYVILLPFFLCVLFLLNMILGITVYKKNTLAARVLACNSLLFATLSLVAYIEILLLVF
jgi:hypothetical protein